jgi:hypothetical protein
MGARFDNLSRRITHSTEAGNSTAFIRKIEVLVGCVPPG